MLQLMGVSREVSVVVDQIGTPTWAHNLAKTVWRLAAHSELKGIYHWTDNGVASWYDFAVAVQEEAIEIGLLSSAVPVRAISSAQRPAPAPRPSFSVLEKQATSDAVSRLPNHHWRSALRSMLKELTVE